MVAKPACASRSESFVNCRFIEWEIFEGFLVIDGTGVHCTDEFHNGDGEVGVAV